MKSIKYRIYIVRFYRELNILWLSVVPLSGISRVRHGSLIKK